MKRVVYKADTKCKFLASLMICLFFLLGIKTTFSQEVTWDDELFVLFFSEKRYNEAFEILSDQSNVPSMLLFQQRGYLMGSGLLSQEFDRCTVVLELERAYALGATFVIGALDFLYGGDWAGIAALEGNPDALTLVGERILLSTIQTNPFLVFDESIGDRGAYTYFYNSSRSSIYSRKEAQVLQLIADIKSRWPNLDFTKLQTEISFKPIRCPLRVEDDNLVLRFID